MVNIFKISAKLTTIVLKKQAEARSQESAVGSWQLAVGSREA
jgi:hypothetical protein